MNFIKISYNVFTFSHISAANFLENTFAVEAKQIQQTVVIGCGQRKALSSKGAWHGAPQEKAVPLF